MGHRRRVVRVRSLDPFIVNVVEVIVTSSAVDDVIVRRKSE